MTSFKTILLATALVAPAMLVAGSASAQSVAVADPQAAVTNSKAFVAATTQIRTTYKAQLDQAQARQAATQTETEPLLRALDTNKDGQLSEAELQAAQAAKRPELASIQQKRAALQQELTRLEGPASRAQQYAVEQISTRFAAAMQAAITKRGAQVVLRPEAALFAQPAADLTAAITAELDAAVPTVSITPPANWQPGQQQGQGQARPAAPATTAPATTRPAERPR